METFNIIWLIDIAAIIIILGSTFKDTKKGFIKSVFGLVVSLLSVLVAFLFADEVVEMTNGAFGLQGSISKSLSATFEEWGLAFDVSQGGIKEKLMEVNFFKGLPFLVDLVVEQIDTGLPAGTMLHTYLGETVGDLATNMVVCIALCALCRLILVVVERVLTSLVESITLFDALNTLLGSVVGFLKGIITVSLICMILSTVPVFSGLMEQMPNTLFVYDWFFVENPLTKILATMIS